MLKSGNAELVFVLTGLDGIIFLRNWKISVSAQAVLLVGVGDDDRRMLFLISQKGELMDIGSRSLRDVID